MPAEPSCTVGMIQVSGPGFASPTATQSAVQNSVHQAVNVYRKGLQTWSTE